MKLIFAVLYASRTISLKAAAPLADFPADFPADEISETPVDFSSVKN